MNHDVSTRLLPPDKEARLAEALRAIYPAGVASEVIEVELHGRAYWFKARYVPWIESVMPLAGKRVLEIGPGTGSSTIAVAERGAAVISIDLNAAGLDVVKTRAELHGVADRISTRLMNASEIGEAFHSQTFDMVVYFASLEHMTHEERMQTLAAAWDMIEPNGFLSVCDAPNRLWFYDVHTAEQNFFHWLPDDLAQRYAARTPRVDFNSAEMTPLTLARWGRGVSYHDFEIAIGVDIRELEVFGEWTFRRDADPEWAEAWRSTPDGQYHHLLRSLSPDIPHAFLEPEIAVMIRKPVK